LTIEEYLEKYPQMRAMACMYYLWWNDLPLDEEDVRAMGFWERITSNPGTHGGDCTQEPFSCNKCLLESMARDAYTFYLKFDPDTTIPAPPNTDPRNKNHEQLQNPN